MIRVLTIEEMLAQPDGSHAVLVDNRKHPRLNVGATLFRGNRDGNYDDDHSVAYSHPDLQGGYDYFYAGEVGVIESRENVFEERFTGLVVSPDKGDPQDIGEILGVFRPELTSRKVGKTRVELVDDGFPLALREVAKVMTWAQAAKGYKDHDWLNLPDAEVALAAAASRHRTDHIMQRVCEGLDTSECVDVESSLHHKAHEAFGVLAQLELMLRGKFVDTHTAHAV